MNWVHLKKIKSMSVDEVFWRFKSKILNKTEEFSYILKWDINPGFNQKIDHPLAGSDFWFFPLDQDLPEIRQRLRERNQSYIQRIREKADAVCAHRFTFFENTFQYGPEISWTADPVSGKPWPMQFHAKVPIFGGNKGFGDVKFVWELNRHQLLVYLAKAYCLTEDESYAKKAIDLIQSWIYANPYKTGINWTSNLEVAVRSLSWVWVYALIKKSKFFNENFRKLFFQSLYQHGRYIQDHLSYYFSPYNHLVGEATALCVLGGVFPFWDCFSKWHEKGWTILEKILPNQFYEDGGGVEQATSYHHFTLGFYLQAALIRRSKTGYIPEKTLKILENAFEFSMFLTQPNGKMPKIGDGDEASALDLGSPSLWDYRAFLSVGAILFQRGDMKKVAGSFYEDAIWLLGIRGLESYEQLMDFEPKSKAKIFPQSGYYIMRSDWGREAHYLNFDFGEIAAGVQKDDTPSAAHGHADALSIEVSAFGTPVLADPGFYTYNGDLKWHRYFRETMAHNTVVVDNHSQAEFRGRLKWSHGPKTELSHSMISKTVDFVEGTHSGYERFPIFVHHRRAIVFVKPDYWLIRDELSGKGNHQLDWYFHFYPVQLNYNDKTKSVESQSASTGNLVVWPFEKHSVELKIFQNGDDPETGWLATGYERKVRAPVVRYRMKGNLPRVFHTLLVPFKGRIPPISIESFPVGPNGDSELGNGLLIEVGGKKDIVFFSRAVQMTSFGKGWSTDARFACVRLNEQGTARGCALVGGSAFLSPEAPLLKLSKKVGFAALSFMDNKDHIEKSENANLSTLSRGSIILKP